MGDCVCVCVYSISGIGFAEGLSCFDLKCDEDITNDCENEGYSEKSVWYYRPKPQKFSVV